MSWESETGAREDSSYVMEAELAEAGDPVGGFGDFGPSHPGLGHLAVFHLIVLYLLLRNQPEFKLTLF